MRLLVGFGVRNQVGEKQPDRNPIAKTVSQVLGFSGWNDVIVSAVKQKERRRGVWRS